jgi:hypothetical protein
MMGFFPCCRERKCWPILGGLATYVKRPAYAYVADEKLPGGFPSGQFVEYT